MFTDAESFGQESVRNQCAPGAGSFLLVAAHSPRLLGHPSVEQHASGPTFLRRVLAPSREALEQGAIVSVTEGAIRVRSLPLRDS